MKQNNSKNRKSRSEEIFEQAENAGRFSGNDDSSRSAREQGIRNINEDKEALKAARMGAGNVEDENSTKTTPQSQDTKGEAQNVNDDQGRPLNDEETDYARNKANEGLRQGRSDG